ncbi:hypothetical protein IAU59_005599 [Kwoniella sp. CBS 9459]
MVRYYRVYLVTGDNDKSVSHGMRHVCTGMNVIVHYQVNHDNDEFIVLEKATSWSGSDIQRAEMSLYENLASYRFWEDYAADYMK